MARQRIHVDLTGTRIKPLVERLARFERRSISATIRLLLEEALTARALSGAGPLVAVDQLLCWKSEDLALEADIALERIEAIQDGATPTEEELQKLAPVINLKTDELRKQFSHIEKEQ
ncbi:MAG: hypothetical protein F6K09_02770 [Merismopedia sp. SIO2A8]|nr:hypothetical protein [Symploca sp. SIO2B6]NET47650.1 hypothetical protein [Merismopedia sp. SIO2A8]